MYSYFYFLSSRDTATSFFFFFNDPPPPEISPLPLHAPLPIWSVRVMRPSTSPNLNMRRHLPSQGRTGPKIVKSPAVRMSLPFHREVGSGKCDRLSEIGRAHV